LFARPLDADDTAAFLQSWAESRAAGMVAEA
jgi:hypothetical protein